MSTYLKRLSFRSRVILFFAILFIAAVWIFRLDVVNRIQLIRIRSISSKATLSNQVFQKAAVYPGHKIYTLTGIERFFPHRVNSITRLQYLYNNFKGFECDIQFDQRTNTFFIGHDGLSGDPTLREFLELDKEKKIFWLDIKNLSVDEDAFCAAIEAIDAKFHIRNRVIIESINKQISGRLAKAGYFTSYYLPQNMDDSTVKKELVDFCGSDPGGIAAVSEDIVYHNSISAFCPQRKQLTWDIAFWHSMNKDLLLKIANDSSILVCLLNIKSPGYR